MIPRSRSRIGSRGGLITRSGVTAFSPVVAWSYSRITFSTRLPGQDSKLVWATRLQDRETATARPEIAVLKREEGIGRVRNAVHLKRRTGMN